MKRTVPSFPQYTITKSGKIWRKQEAVVPLTHKDHHNLNHLAVRLNDSRQFVWKLLSETWYDGALILTRDGGLLNWDEDNTFRMKDCDEAINMFGVSRIQLIWWHYQHERIPCVSMSRETGLSVYSVDEYRSLIEKILISSVR